MEQGRKGKGLATQQQQQQPRRCPRCESTNTKFCYYNNYSQSQPRHFCKACRRYWTEGGTLRNVPQGGGGGRKGKRTKKTASAALAVSPSSGTADRNNSVSLQAVPEATLPPPPPYFFSGGGIGEGLMGLQGGNHTGFHSGGGIMTDFGEQSVVMPLMLPQGFLNFPMQQQQQNLLLPIEPSLMINQSSVPAPHRQFINTAMFTTTAAVAGPTVSTAAAGVCSGEGFWSTVFGNGGLSSGLPPPPNSPPF